MAAADLRISTHIKKPVQRLWLTGFFMAIAGVVRFVIRLKLARIAR